MEILELELQHFGKFLDHRVRLHEGINVISGGNETGKTTIYAFIRAMFFGIETGRGRKGEEYQRRCPWDDPSYFSGTIRFSSRGNVFRLERDFQKDHQKVRLLCETDGREYAAEPEELMKLFGGTPEEIVRQTIFWGQNENVLPDSAFLEWMEQESSRRTEMRSEQRDFEESGSRMEQSVYSSAAAWEADKMADAERQQARRALRYLEEKEVKLEKEGQDGIWSENTRKLSGKAVWRQLRKGQRTPEEDWQEEEKWSESPGQGEEEDREQERDFYRIFLLALNLLLPLCGILGVASGLLASALAAKICLLGLGVGFLALAFLTVRYTVQERVALFADRTDETQKMGIREERQRPDLNMSEIRYAEAEKTEKDTERQEELEALKLAKAHIRKAMADLEEVRDKNEDGKSGFNSSVSGYEERYGETSRKPQRDWQESTSEILVELTGGRYREIFLGEKGELRVATSARELGTGQLSFSTQQQVGLALRAAAGEVLANGERVPLVLDEPFAMYDEKRREAALRWLKKSGRQVILFTSDAG